MGWLLSYDWLAPARVRLRRHPLSVSLLGDRLEERRNELRATLQIGRVVGPPMSPSFPSTS